jgi:hypothetical protein
VVAVVGVVWVVLVGVVWVAVVVGEGSGAAFVVEVDSPVVVCARD